MSATTSSKDVIFQTANIDTPIIIKEQKGFFQNSRRKLATLLMLTFILLPFFNYEGQQAILFDVGAQKLYLFSLILYPQDLLIFVFVFVIAAFALFLISSRYGRVWCGYLCPQTIWSFLFFWLQFRVEGNYQSQKRLAKEPLSTSKVVKKGLKHTLWLFVSLLTAITFMSYFVPVTELYMSIFNGEISALLLGWVMTFMACTYINAGWIKEKMCEHMCPYSRFQSAMVDETTKQISYDGVRGEPRAPRKLNRHKPEQLGDCVDCNQCVQVCPVGIDIRNGFQYECISCGLCIDACDQVMKRFNYASGLISYKAMAKGKTFQSVAYISVLALFLILFFGWFMQRPLFELNVVKDRNILYRTTIEGSIENTYELKLINKSQQPTQFVLSLEGLDQFTINQDKLVSIDADSSKSVLITVASTPYWDGKSQPFNFVLTSKDHTIAKASVFHNKP